MELTLGEQKKPLVYNLSYVLCFISQNALFDIYYLYEMFYIILFFGYVRERISKTINP